MHRLLFLSRVAFICNLFFVLCLLMRHTSIHIPAGLHEFIIITGWILSFFVNLLFMGTVVVLKMTKKEIPLLSVLSIANISCFIFQIFYYLISYQ